MAFNGSGTFVRVHSWESDAAADIDITASRMDAEDDGFATGLTACLTRNGENSPSADLPMGGFAHTGVALSGARTEYARTDQVQDSLFTYAADSGAADAYVIALSPAITAYAAGQRFSFLPANTCSGGAVTLNVNGVGAATVTTWAGATPLFGAIVAGQLASVEYDGTNFVLMSVQQRPQVASQAEMEAGTETATRSMDPERVFQSVDYRRGLRVRADSTTETVSADVRNGCTIATLTGDITKTLPAISTLPSGCIYAFQVISNSGTDKMSIVPNAADNIHFYNDVTYDLVEMIKVGDYVELLADDVNGVWRVITDKISGPSFEATYVGSAVVLSAGVAAKVAFNTEVSDPFGVYDNATNYRFTPGVPGEYIIDSGVYFRADGSTRCDLYLYKNGSHHKTGQRTTTSSTGRFQQSSWLVEANSTDYFEIYVEMLDSSGDYDDPVELVPYFKAVRLK